MTERAEQADRTLPYLVQEDSRNVGVRLAEAQHHLRAVGAALQRAQELALCPGKVDAAVGAGLLVSIRRFEC